MAGYVIAASVLPNLVLIAAGHLVGEIPAASVDGLGRITASGDHASLIRAGGLCAELYELQAHAYR